MPPNTQIHHYSFSWLDTDTLKNIAWLIPLGEMLCLWKYFPHRSKIPTLAYNQSNRVIIKNAIILNIIKCF